MQKILQLRNVSKFYYTNGQVSSGFTKVSLDLSMGEFVAIVGESGSGKSTLLNVLSGLDNYQEGEMYILGQETSHYGDLDFEEYRKRYIGNIFQNFNLINSYTVYQNIELMMLTNGHTGPDVKKRIKEVIEQVGLTKYTNQKVSKLSGGQKQRVAIARVLAKDTPIIVADEPTGNLDVESANSIFEILHEISKDKLVIVVTHNYEQAEPYVTRKIRMHDGQIVEDEVIREAVCDTPYEPQPQQSMKWTSRLRLGIRNTFNVPIKFVLLMMVFLLICTSIMSGYTTLAYKQDVQAQMGYSYFFNDISAERVIIKKKDGTSISAEEFEALEKLDNVDYVIKEDISIDNRMNAWGDMYSFYGKSSLLSNFHGELTYGRMPETPYEVIVRLYEEDYYVQEGLEQMMNSTVHLYDDWGNQITDQGLTIVGVSTMDINEYMLADYNCYMYIDATVMDLMRISTYKRYSTIKTKFNGSINESQDYMAQYRVVPSKKVKKGTVLVSEDTNWECPKYKCTGLKMTVTASNLYYETSLKLKVKGTYNKKNFKKKTGLKDYQSYNGAYFVNVDDYNSLFDQDPFQSSIYVKDTKTIQDTLTTLENMGYKTLRVQDGLVSYSGGYEKILNIFNAAVYMVIAIVLFFISYFIISLIYRSRNIYYSTIRILGANKKVAKSLLSIELFTVTNLAFIVVCGAIYAVRLGYVEFEMLQKIVDYLQLRDYIVCYVAMMIVSFLITNRYSKKLFQKSAMDTYRQQEG